jgi:predicted Zn-dependent protease
MKPIYCKECNKQLNRAATGREPTYCKECYRARHRELMNTGGKHGICNSIT